MVKFKLVTAWFVLSTAQTASSTVVNFTNLRDMLPKLLVKSAPDGKTDLKMTATYAKATELTRLLKSEFPYGDLQQASLKQSIFENEQVREFFASYAEFWEQVFVYKKPMSHMMDSEIPEKAHEASLNFTNPDIISALNHPQTVRVYYVRITPLQANRLYFELVGILSGQVAITNNPGELSQEIRHLIKIHKLLQEQEKIDRLSREIALVSHGLNINEKTGVIGDYWDGKRTYAEHLAGVVDGIEEYDLLTEYWRLRTGAWLHDVAEDTKTKIEYLRALFGDENIDPVELVTKIPKEEIPDKRLRYQRSYQKVGESEEASILKAVDRQTNLRLGTENFYFGGLSKKQKYINDWAVFSRYVRHNNLSPGAQALWNDIESLIFDELYSIGYTLYATAKVFRNGQNAEPLTWNDYLKTIKSKEAVKLAETLIIADERLKGHYDAFE